MSELAIERASCADTNDRDFLSGGGELGQLIRNFDWRESPLGVPETWPQNLRMALRIMLTSLQPIWIGWGKELIYFYNDPYKSIVGGKHPWALGRPTAEVWRELWSDIGPMLDTATRGGQGTYVKSQLLIMERNGYPEETYYTFSYSPIPNDDGSVGGIFCANSEDTQRVFGERQLSLLGDLAAGTAHARSRQEVCDRAMEALGNAAHDLPFAMMYLAEPGTSSAMLTGASGVTRGHRAAPQTVALDDGSVWPIGATIRRQRMQEVLDLSTRIGTTLPTGPWSEPPQHAVVLPILPTGETGRAGALVVGINPFRLFDENYRSFLNLAAGQIAAALANAQAYEEERRRAEALAQIDLAKTTFFSNVSHEFRTPLTLMLGPVEDALNDTAAALPPVQRLRLETAHRNSLRLLKLVNSLLDFSRIESGRLEASYEPTQLEKYTGELASNFHSATEKAGLALNITCPQLPQMVHVDRDMWEKIVLNLLSNAFKFTFRGSITVQMRASADGRAAELLVRDTGVGIPEAELPRLFERFHRVEGQSSRSFEGSGIGLALVQELVRLHSGTIRVHSEVGSGTEFTVSMPFGTAHLAERRISGGRAQEPHAKRAEAYVEEALRWLPEVVANSDAPTGRSDETVVLQFPAKMGGARVLIAEDNADMRHYLRRLLGTHWHVEAVPDGAAALRAIRAHKPDLLISDVMMPELDGFSLLRQLRADPQLRDLPVILLSARAGEDAQVEGLDAGADDYLTKPFSARELVARVNSTLETARIRREATSDLRESESRFRNMADHAPMMTWVTDPTGSLTYLNRGWAEFTGQTPDAALGRGAWDALHPADRASSEKIFLDANDARRAFRIEYRLRRADGVYRWALSAAAPRFGDNAEFLGYIGSVIDITERKEAEQVLEQANEILEARVAAAITERANAEAQLRQAQKMESLGRLTGGVAHDFNNVLQVIGGNLQLLRRDVAGEPTAEQRVQIAVAAVHRGSKLASQLLAFGRRQPLAPKVVNLGRLVRGMDDMLRRALGEGVEIETIVAGGLWNTLVDTVQVENALLNLAINSRDAMDGHGRLTIEAGNAFLDDSYAANHSEVAAGQYVMLAVSDTGCGIPAELIDRVIEPFFTTKPEGQGTGLGLSMVYGFVKQSGGHIKIYSEPAQGTTMRLYLPRVRQPEDLETNVATGPAAGGMETVLVAEDDAAVRATVVDMLSELGYRVLQAKDAQSALTVIEGGAPIDLLFTDVVMPGALRSPELARKARERRPNIAVLFTSGYTQNAIVHGGRVDEGIDLLSKPYSREALARKIRHVLHNQEQRLLAQARSAQSAGVPIAQQERASGSRKLQILLVEDDADIREVTAVMLSALGHHATETRTGGAALEQLAARTFDVLVTDLTLPDIPGHELAIRALRLRPGLRIVFASGHASSPKAAAQSELEWAIFLQKPYDDKQLAAALAAATSRLPV
ncbi:MAG TPA: response regulator [Steroidobacteraceae bacterium]